MLNIPTSKDIYIEVDGVKVALVQSYSAKSTKSSMGIESFGSETPVATVSGKVEHEIELKKVIPILSAQTTHVDFYNLSNFNLMVVKPDHRIVYTGCEWSNISEKSELNQPCIESITLLASKRMVLR